MTKKEQPSEFTLDYHFRGKKASMKPLFEELIGKLRTGLEFEFKIGKSYIGLIHQLVFCAVYIQTRKIVVEFVARKVFQSPRIKTSSKCGKNRWAYFVDIEKPQDIDQQLIHWISESYE